MLLKLLAVAAGIAMLLLALRRRIGPFLPRSARAALDGHLEKATNALVVALAAAAMLTLAFLLFLHWLDRA